MQSNTTGHSMETFFDIAFLCLLTYSIIKNVSMSKDIHLIQLENEYFKRKFLLTCDELCVKTDDTNRSLLALRDLLEPTKPMKSNNWDSIREAFKGPARVEINERN